MDKKTRNLILGGVALLVVLLVGLSVSRNRRDQRLLSETRGPEFYSVEQIRDWRGLMALAATNVKGRPSPSRRVAELMGADIKQILADGKKSGSLPDDRKVDVVRGLNDLLKRRDLYQVADFRGVKLPEEARQIASQHDILDREVEWHNRMLMDVCFPKLFTPHRGHPRATRVAAGKALIETGRAVDLILAQPAHIEERRKQFGARDVVWSDASVRKDAIWAIGQAGLEHRELRTQALDVLVGLMKGVDREQQDITAKVRDEDGAARAMPWKLMTRYGTMVIPRLVAALRDPSGTVRDGAVEGLGTQGAAAIKPVLRWVRERDTRGKAIEVLFRVHQPAVDAAIQLLNDRDDEVRAAAADLLGRLDNERAVPALLSRIDDPAPNIRRNIIRSLGVIASPLATLEVARVMKEDPQVRMEAITALGEIADPRGIDPLIATFKGYDLDVPAAAIAALNKIGTRAIPRLLQEAKNPDPDIRLHATRGLAVLTHPTVVQPLIAAAKDPSAPVREAAIGGMSKFAGRDALAAIPTLVNAFRDTSAAVAYAASASLTEMASTGSAEVRDAVVRPLAQLLSREEEPTAQFYANKTLAQIGGPAVVSALVAQLKSGDPTTQKWAALTLGDVEQKEEALKAEGALRDLAARAEGDVRWAAEEALRKMGREVATRDRGATGRSA